jgi:putative ABC transport system permease protein
MISLRTLLLFYRRHLRVQPLRELMAVIGVAAGVALFFAVQIANSSVTGSFEQATRSVAGRATLEVSARSPEGFEKGIEQQVASTAGVRRTAPILTQQVVLAGPSGSRPVTLVGADGRLVALGGSLVAQFERYAESEHQGWIVLTQSTADAIGAAPGKTVAVQTGGQTRHATVDAVVPSGRLGTLAETPVAAAPLPIVEHLTGLSNRITRILVEPAPGEEAFLRTTLAQRFGATLNVRSIRAEGELLADAAKPETQLTALFSAISLAVGIILAYNALLLASGERQAFIDYLIRLGTQDIAIVASLAFDALILGIAGSVIGLLAGDGISLLAYRAPPGYLAAAFPIGGQRVFGLDTMLIAFAAGILAAFAAAALPAIAALRSSPIEPEGRTLLFVRRARFNDSLAFACGATLLCIAIVASLLRPGVVVFALVLLLAGLVVSLPAIVRQAVRLARRWARRSGDPSARLAAGELTTAPTRSVALVATGTIAVFLMVTIGGAVADVQRAVRNGAEQTGATADLWIKPGGAQNVYGTQSFAYLGTQRTLQRLPVVRSVLAYRESFLDLPGQRIWVIGIPPPASGAVANGQLIDGSGALAAARLHQGGWAALSQTIARERHLRLGQSFSLPTPSGTATFRLAATISNYGWLPGTVLLNGDEYSRLWRTSRANQLAVTLQPGVPVAQGRIAVQQALPAGSALTVQTTQERQAQVSTVLGSTLSRLNQTSTVVLIAAIATVIAMMISSVWQRRGRLDTLTSMGMSVGQLSRLVFYESGCVLLLGCLMGMVSGVVGQYLVESWLRHSTGSPIVYTAAWTLGLRTLLIAVAVSIVASIIAVVRTLGFQANTAFSTE